VRHPRVTPSGDISPYCSTTWPTLGDWSDRSNGATLDHNWTVPKDCPIVRTKMQRAEARLGQRPDIRSARDNARQTEK